LSRQARVKISRRGFGCGGIFCFYPIHDQKDAGNPNRRRIDDRKNSPRANGKRIDDQSRAIGKMERR